MPRSLPGYPTFGKPHRRGALLQWVRNQDRPAVAFVEPPAAPTGLLRSVSGGIKLDWTDNATNELGYRVAKNTSRGGFNETFATIAANSITFTDAAGDSTNGYRVRAHHASAVSAWADHLPLDPFGLATNGYAALSRSLTWSLGAGNPGISTSVEVHRKIGAAAYALLVTLPANTVNYTDSEDLTASIGQTLAYKVRENSSKGTTGFSVEISGTIV